jgi:putative DNA primase/helicase
MGLRHPSCTGQGRGTSADVYALGSLWIEVDHNQGVHSKTTLPTPLQLTMFLRSLPFACSLQLNSGGGFHLHLLLRELWILDTDAERQRAATLLTRLQRTVQQAAQTHGWTIDTTSDLARVLRLPGTYNWKSGTPQPVTVVAEHPRRYNPSDLEDAPWLAPLDPPPRSLTQLSLYPPGDLQRILDRCAWLHHCYQDAPLLSEPEWYAALGIIGRCADGPTQAHTWSQPYPRYTPDETDTKLTHALTAAGPRTCHYIRHKLDGEAFCATCPHWGKVKSPAVLSLDDGARLRLRAASWRTRRREGR